MAVRAASAPLGVLAGQRPLVRTGGAVSPSTTFQSLLAYDAGHFPQQDWFHKRLDTVQLEPNEMFIVGWHLYSGAN